MSESKVVFIEGRCQTTGKLFYIRYDKTLKDYWILSRGVLPEDMEGGTKGGSAFELNLEKSATGPHYACPYCGARGYVRCGSCGKVSCRKWGSKEFTCAWCEHTGKLTGSVIQSISGNSKKGQ